MGSALGLSGYTFVYARGYSYLTNDPRACVNCHVMNEQYDAWVKASHRAVATFNDCHTPHDFFGKYSNGFHAPQEVARILGEAIDYLRQG